MRKPTITLEDGTEQELPFAWAICSSCDGHGKSSRYLGAFTSEQMHELGDDFREDYMRGGYDRRCDRCNGSGKVASIDRKRCTKAQLKSWDDDREQERLEESEALWERRMLGGDR